MVPACPFTFGTDRGVASLLLLKQEQIEGHVSDDRQVLSGVAASDSALILSEREVQDPMQRVLNAPVASRVRQQLRGVAGQTGGVLARFN